MICYDHKHPSDRRSWWECSTFRVQSKLASREKTGMPRAAKRQGAEAEVTSFLGLPFTPATSFTCRPTWLRTISCKSTASYDFEPIYQAPAGVINPGERAKNEMSLIQTVEIPKQIKKDTFLWFLLFCFSSGRPRRRSGFYHVQFPLEKFCFSWRQHLYGLFDLRLFFQGSRVKGHTYINGMLHNYLQEERTWAGCRRICQVLRLLFSRFLGIPCFPLVEIQRNRMLASTQLQYGV